MRTLRVKLLTPHSNRTTSRCWLFLLSTLLSLVPSIATQANPALPKSSNSVAGDSPYGAGKYCPQPALSRLIRHKVAPGETIESIARQHNLIPATLMGINPALQQGKAAVGSDIVIPPYNGIRIAVPASQTWRSVAAKYKVRTDILFEVNGCQREPREVFVPGVNWSPKRPATPAPGHLAGYPLPAVATVGLAYGWRLNPNTGKVFFNSGVDLLAASGTPVRAVGAGTVAFAGERGIYGNLVVVNHQGGQQTRYASLNTIAVHAGQVVKLGELLGTVGLTGKTPIDEPHLHFEVRYASSLGWVAEDPGPYLQQKQKQVAQQ